MNRDLFFLYIHNNRIGVLYFSVVTFIFIYGRFTLKALPETGSFFIAGIALVVALLFLIKQQTLYKQTLLEPNLPTKTLQKRALHIALNKLGYMIPWLTVLFWPVNSNEFYDHMLGYVFIFSAITLYAATSANFLPLFFWDLAIQAVFATLVIAINFNADETIYVSVALALSLTFSVFLGLRTHQTSSELIDKKQQLEYAKHKAESVSQAKSDFLAIMSHEVRTPLTGIMGMTDFLKNSKLTQKQLSYIATIQSCSKSLLKTLNDALDLSKIEAGKLDINYENYNIRELLQNVTRTVEILAKEKKLTLNLTIDESLPEQAYGDADRLTQVTLNLLNNAIKFTRKGKIELKARLNEENMLQFDIIDTGIGISDQDQAKLFKKFSQIKHDMENQQVGTGLGLSITKHLVQLMNGYINVESKPGEGSRFWFAIPYKQPIDSPDTKQEELQHFETKSISVLIVEDNHVNQMVVEKIFSDKGHTPTIVGTGEQALEVLSSNHYDLILMDINLPDILGTEVSARIREEMPEHDDTPILAVTANIGKSIVNDLKLNGMDGYISKPYDLQQLVSTSIASIKERKGLEKLSDNEQLYVTQTQESTDETDRKPRIRTLIDEFGIEYAQHHIETSLTEIERLLQSARKHLGNNEFSAIEQDAHDLKSMCGSLDMNSAYVSADIIETLIKQEFYKDLDKLLDGIEVHISYETEELKDIIESQNDLISID